MYNKKIMKRLIFERIIYICNNCWFRCSYKDYMSNICPICIEGIPVKYRKGEIINE